MIGVSRPYKESHHPRYIPLNKVNDDAILKVGISRFNDSSDDFLEPQNDHSASALSSEKQ